MLKDLQNTASENCSEETGLMKVLTEIYETVSKLFMPPLLKYTLVIIAMEFAILVGYVIWIIYFEKNVSILLNLYFNAVKLLT